MIGYYNTPKKIKLNKLLALILTVVIMMMPLNAFAEITGPEAFDDIEWEEVMESDLEMGIVQSIVTTEDYIICLCNVADDASVDDIVYAYYRNNKDENGDPVEPYTLAKRVENHEWEHCNGMAYNPNTNEIYVALYTNTIENNKGCLYVMDPVTLNYKGRLKISKDYNILGIEYIPEKDQYVIQTNDEGGYSIKILNNEFEEVDDFGEFESVNVGTNYQDLTVSEDYILNFPLTMGLGIGEYLNVFSLSQKSLLSQPATDFKIDTDYNIEPESLTVIGDGEFLAVVNLYDSLMFKLYKAQVPFNYYITVKAENGTVSKKKITVQRGENATVDFMPDEKFEFSSLTLDGKEQTLAEDATSFTIPHVDRNHEISVTFTEIPFPWRQVLTIAGISLAALILLIVLIVVLVKRRRKRQKSEELKQLQERRRLREEKLRHAADDLDAIESEIGIDPVSEITAATAAEVTASKEPAETETTVTQTAEAPAETVEETAKTAVQDMPAADVKPAKDAEEETPAEEKPVETEKPAKPVPVETVYMPLEEIDDDDDAFAARIAERFSKYQSPVQALAKKKAEEAAKAEAEAKAKAEEEARLKALEEAEAKAKAEEEAMAEAEAKAQEEAMAEAEAKAKAEEEAMAEAEAKAKAEEEARLKAERAKARKKAKAKARAEAKAKAEAEEKARKEAEFNAQLEAKMKAFEAALAKADQIQSDTRTRHGSNIETQRVEIEVKTTRRVNKQ